MLLITKVLDDPKLDLLVALMAFADKIALIIYAALGEQERDDQGYFG